MIYKWCSKIQTENSDKTTVHDEQCQMPATKPNPCIFISNIYMEKNGALIIEIRGLYATTAWTSTDAPSIKISKAAEISSHTYSRTQW